MKIRNLFLPIFAAFFLSGCGSDPEDVAEDYIKAIFDRDYKETYKLEFHDIPIDYQMYYEMMRRIMPPAELDSVKIEKVVEVQDIVPGVPTVKVITEVKAEGERSPSRVTLTLVDVDGWKISR